MTTASDVVAGFIQRSDHTIETDKLHALCFYAFGWYAHLTAEPLFKGTFTITDHGVVIEELSDDMTAARELDPYQASVLDAVWAIYGDLTPEELTTKAHKESLCDTGSQSHTISTDDIIQHFVDKHPTDKEHSLLPPAMIFRASVDTLQEIEAQAHIHTPYIQSVLDYCRTH